MDSILAVMVRYQTPLPQSPTVQGLARAFQEQPALLQSLNVLIWDNSPQPLVQPRLTFPFLYGHLPANPGPSGAYNRAMDYALQHGFTWMMLLDQDTELTTSSLLTLLDHARALQDRATIAAIAPTICVRGSVVSPRRYLFNHHRAYPLGEVGVASGEAFAINSGAVLRVSSLQKIGGFSTEFWLDYSDIYVFHQFYLHGMEVWRAADTQIEHDMSIMDYDRLMTPWRYRNYSFAETAFNDLYKGRLENTAQTLRVFLRALRQRRKYRNPEFSRIAWEQFLYRLRVSRRTRIARWNAAAKVRLAAASHTGVRKEDTIG